MFKINVHKRIYVCLLLRLNIHYTYAPMQPRLLVGWNVF